jgi:hypothetical protein
MRQALQLLVFVGAIAGLIAYGFHRDKKEHKPAKDAQQGEIYFPEHPQDSDEREHRGAMSRL